MIRWWIDFTSTKKKHSRRCYLTHSLECCHFSLSWPTGRWHARTTRATRRRHSRSTGTTWRRTSGRHGRRLHRTGFRGKLHHNPLHAADEHHFSFHVALGVNGAFIAANQAALFDSEGKSPILHLGRLQKRYRCPLSRCNIHPGGLGLKIDGGLPFRSRGMLIDHVCHKNPFFPQKSGRDKRLRPSVFYYSFSPIAPQEKPVIGT